MFCHPFATLISRVVVIKTEGHHLRSFHPRQNPPYRFIAGAAAGHIAVLLPVLRMQGDIGEKVDRGLKYIQVPIRPRVVKAVSRVTARHVEFEGLALAVGAALLRVTGNAVFVCSDEHGVVIFRILIERSRPKWVMISRSMCRCFIR